LRLLFVIGDLSCAGVEGEEALGQAAEGLLSNFQQ
jgi:hypothetical protein